MTMDLAAAWDALTRAEAALTEVRKALSDEQPEPEPAGKIALESFAWSGKKTSDPTNLPAGAKYGEDTKDGKRTCQWKWGTIILHAVFSESARTATGRTCKWYHFTRTAQLFPALNMYRWTNTHKTPDAGGIWYRWAA